MNIFETFAVFGQGVYGKLIYGKAGSISPAAVSFVLSGGTSNQFSEASIGGEKSFEIAPITLFPDILSSVRDDIVDYRCIYIQNESLAEFTSFEIFIQDKTGEGSEIELGLGGNVNDTAFLLSNDLSIPPGVNFYVSPLLVGDFNVGDYIPLWIQRTTPRNNVFESQSNNLIIGVRGLY